MFFDTKTTSLSSPLAPAPSPHPSHFHVQASSSVLGLAPFSPSPPAFFPPQLVFQHPPVHYDIVKCRTSFRVVPQKPCQKVTCVGVNPFGDGEVDPGNALVGVASMLLLKGWMANKELVEKHTESPDIDALVVLTGLDHLGREVVESAAHGGSSVAGIGGRVAADVGGPAEVGKLDAVVEVDEDVFGLEVPVDEVLAVEVLQGTGDLVDVVGGERVGEALEPGEGLVELAVGGVLDHEVDVLVVLEPAVERKTVLVQDVGLDLDLADDLLLDVVGHDLLLGHHLQRAHVAAALLAHTVHLAKLALPQALPDLEVRELPLTCLAFSLARQHRAAPRHAQSVEHIRLPCPWRPRHAFLHRRLVLHPAAAASACLCLAWTDTEAPAAHVNTGVLRSSQNSFCKSNISVVAIVFSTFPLFFSLLTLSGTVLH